LSTAVEGAAAGVAARDAASLVVVAPAGEGGPAVLMGLRGPGHRFSPNRLVFPGGAVEPEDFDAPAATPLPDALRAARAAARELLEETGLSLGAPPALDGLAYLCRAVTPPGAPIRFNARFLMVAAARVGGVLGGSGELEALRFWPVAEAMAADLHPVQHGVLEQVRQRLAGAAEGVGMMLFEHRRWVEEEGAV
jgi:8-oxo-dGTP pyrophosphatase MutT (NUDIX family)